MFPCACAFYCVILISQVGSKLAQAQDLPVDVTRFMQCSSEFLKPCSYICHLMLVLSASRVRTKKSQPFFQDFSRTFQGPN